MKLTGYTDRLSVAPGESIRVMISCAEPAYATQLVRLVHGDPHPDGPGFKEAEIASSADGTRPGRVQEIHAGSYVRVDDPPSLPADGFTLAAWIMPTLPGKGAQAILARRDPETGRGFSLELDEAGGLALSLGDGDHERWVRTDAPLRKGAWFWVAASVDLARGEVTLIQRPLDCWPLDRSDASVIRGGPLPFADANGPLLIAARALDGGAPCGCFNGKIEAPLILSRAPGPDELAELAIRPLSELARDDVLAAWDFSQEMSTSLVRENGPLGRDGRAVNLPTRAVTGRSWSGDHDNPANAPEEYGAIHFHDDDLEDAGWQADFAWTVPEDLPSGVYAFRLRAGGAEDHLPFVVLPPRGRATNKIAYLISTFTYLAYADEHMPVEPVELFPFLDPNANLAEYAYIAKYKLNSLYDTHTDDSGVCYASWRRPLVNTRPKAYFRVYSSPERLSADLYLTDWLEAKGLAYDALADETIHDEGVDLLRRYPVLVTGSHPEYWTRPMLDALAAYIAAGGRVTYLGGNGFYWVTGVDPERPHVIEIRRAHGTRTWDAAPGETHLSTTGEQGGLWRHRNRAPQKLLGVGFTSQGNDYSRPYDRLPASRDPRAAFIFEGVGEERIGDFPSLMLRHGAAGYEIDRADFALGTPPHALVLATATGFSDSYQHVIEETISTDGEQGGTVDPLVRADIVYFEGPNDGAVFSVGSIAWLGALSHNHYDNNVSRITENVLRRFAFAPSALGRSQ